VFAENIYIYCCLSVSIFVYSNMKYNTINIDYYNIDKDNVTCAIQLDSTYNKSCILTIYRSPRVNFTNFLNRLDLISQKIYNIRYSIIICGDVNVHCVIDNNVKSQLDAVLHSCNLACIVKFPTKIGLNSHTAIGNVFIDTSTIAKYAIYRLIHGLSNHDALLLIINKVQKQEMECHTGINRKINKCTIADFQLKLSHETRKPVLKRKM